VINDTGLFISLGAFVSEIDILMGKIHMDFYNYEGYGQCEIGA